MQSVLPHRTASPTSPSSAQSCAAALPSLMVQWHAVLASSVGLVSEALTPWGEQSYPAAQTVGMWSFVVQGGQPRLESCLFRVRSPPFLLPANSLTAKQAICRAPHSFITAKQAICRALHSVLSLPGQQSVVLCSVLYHCRASNLLCSAQCYITAEQAICCALLSVISLPSKQSVVLCSVLYHCRASNLLCSAQCYITAEQAICCALLSVMSLPSQQSVVLCTVLYHCPALGLLCSAQCYITA